MDKNNSYEENEKGFELTEHSINIWMKKFKRTSIIYQQSELIRYDLNNTTKWSIQRQMF